MCANQSIVMRPGEADVPQSFTSFFSAGHLFLLRGIGARRFALGGGRCCGGAMEMRHLRYFVVLAEECHFGRAAKRLHMAQSPLSHQIRQLEDELGVALFQRTTRRVALTAAGERYLERVREVLRGVEVAGEEARRIAAGDTGHLAIGFTGSATYEMLPTLSRDLRNSFPGIELDLKGELLTPDQVAALLSGELDVGFLRPPVSRSGPRCPCTALGAAHRGVAGQPSPRTSPSGAPRGSRRRGLHLLPLARQVGRA